MSNASDKISDDATAQTAPPSKDDISSDEGEGSMQHYPLPFGGCNVNNTAKKWSRKLRNRRAKRLLTRAQDALNFNHADWTNNGNATVSRKPPPISSRDRKLGRK